MRRALWGIVLLALVLAACGADGGTDNTAETGQGELGLFDWNRDPDSIIVRLDSRPTQENPAYLLNSIPPCTLWGDGRLVWSTYDQYGAEELLEARITDDSVIRAFLEDIIERGFYDWEDEIIPPGEDNPVIETITVSLYGEVRTVKRFSFWPQNAYLEILKQCQQLSDTPVRVLPDAGWVSAYQVPRDTSAPSWLWPPNAPFTLQELAENGEERWLEGPLATEVWRSARERVGDIQVIERNGNAYEVAIVVPGYSRDKVLPPDQDPMADS